MSKPSYTPIDHALSKGAAQISVQALQERYGEFHEFTVSDHVTTGKSLPHINGFWEIQARRKDGLSMSHSEQTRLSFLSIGVRTGIDYAQRFLGLVIAS